MEKFFEALVYSDGLESLGVTARHWTSAWIQSSGETTTRLSTEASPSVAQELEPAASSCQAAPPDGSRKCLLAEAVRVASPGRARHVLDFACGYQLLEDLLHLAF